MFFFSPVAWNLLMKLYLVLLILNGLYSLLLSFRNDIHLLLLIYNNLVSFV